MLENFAGKQVSYAAKGGEKTRPLVKIILQILKKSMGLEIQTSIESDLRSIEIRELRVNLSQKNFNQKRSSSR